MNGFLPVMLDGIAQLESKAYNVAKNTEADFVANVREEFGFHNYNGNHIKHLSTFTDHPKYYRSINHRSKKVKNLV